MPDSGFLKKSFTFVCMIETGGLAVFVGFIVADVAIVRIIGFAVIDGTICFDPEWAIEITYGFATTRFPFAGTTLANRSQSKCFGKKYFNQNNLDCSTALRSDMYLADN